MLEHQIRVLGVLAVTGEGRSTLPRTLKGRALLAYLAGHAGQALERPALAGLLWPDSDRSRAAHSLRQAASEVRRALPAGALQATRQTLGLAPSLWVDAPRFEAEMDRWQNFAWGDEAAAEALVTALELYQGDFLSGFSVEGAPEFDLWLVAVRERLRVKALGGLERLAIHHLAQGRYPAAEQWFARLLALDPWHEAAHRGLMQVYAWTGRPGAAVAQYDRASAALRDDLGVEPDESTRRVYEQARSGAQSMAPLLPFGAAPPRPEPPFVGRAQPHGRLAQALAARQAGVGGPVLLLVEGEAGAGKTRLAEEFGRYAAGQGAAWVRGRCYEFGEPLAYQPWVEALEQALALAGASVADLDPAWLDGLARLLPAQLPERSPAAGLPGGDGRQTIFAAVWALLALLVKPHQPVVVFLDDLQWADPASLDLLHYVTRQAGTQRLLVVGAYRPEDTPAGHPLRQLRHGLAREALVETLPLAALTAADLLELVGQRLEANAAEQLADFLLRASEGNPLFLSETINQLFESGGLRLGAGDAWQLAALPLDSPATPTVEGTILRRVERLPADSLAALRVAATIGRHFDQALVQAVCGAAPWMDEWVAHRLVRPTATPGRYDFAHDVIRAVVYRSQSEAARAELHGRVAAGLEALHTGRLDRAAAGLAHHYRLSTEPRRAGPHLRRAAQQAGQALAFSTVVDLCRQALNLEPEPAERFRFLDMLQRAHQFLGQTEAEGQAAEALLALAEAADDPRLLAVAGERLALFHARRGQPKQAVTAAEAALGAARVAGAPVLGSKSMVLLAMLLRGETEGAARARDYLQLALAQARAAGERRDEAYALGHLGVVLAEGGAFGEAIQALEQSLALLEAAGDESVRANGLYSLAGIFRVLGQWERAEAALQEALRLSERHALRGVELPLRLGLGKLRLEQGNLTGARESFAAAQALAQRFQRSSVEAEARLGLGQVALAAGQPAVAGPHLLAAQAGLGQANEALAGMATAALADMQRGLGETARALALATTARQQYDQRPASIGEMAVIYAAYAAALEANGQVAEARAARDEGRARLMAQARGLPESWRTAFLSRVDANRALLTTTPERPRVGAPFPLSGWAEALAASVVAMLQARREVRGVAVFGSRARGQPDGWSDVDLLVLVDGGPFEAWNLFAALRQTRAILYHHTFTLNAAGGGRALGCVFEGESVFHHVDLNIIAWDQAGQPEGLPRFAPWTPLAGEFPVEAVTASKPPRGLPQGWTPPAPHPAEAQLGLPQHWLKKALKAYLRGQGPLSRVQETAAEVRRVLSEATAATLPTGDLRQVAQTYLEMADLLLAHQPFEA